MKVQQLPSHHHLWPWNFIHPKKYSIKKKTQILPQVCFAKGSGRIHQRRLLVPWSSGFPTASVQFIWCSRCSRCQVCVLLFHSSNNCWKKSGIHSPVYPPLFTRFQKHRGGDVWKSTVVSKCVLKKDRSHSANLGVQNVCISLGFSTLLSKNRKQATWDLQGVVLLHTLGPQNHEKWRF